MKLSPTQQKIVDVCDQVRSLLLEKNRAYGNSALEPTRIFAPSALTAQSMIEVRIDDKLSRIAQSGLTGTDEDTLLDLIGYLILLRVAGLEDTAEKKVDSEIDRKPSRTIPVSILPGSDENSVPYEDILEFDAWASWATDQDSEEPHPRGVIYTSKEGGMTLGHLKDGEVVILGRDEATSKH